MLTRTLRTGKSDSPARSPLSRTTPARSALSGDFVFSGVAVAGGAAGRALDAGKRAEELHLAVALGPRDPEDLALGDAEIDGAETLSAQLRDLEERLGLRAFPGSLGEGVLERPADHQGDERLLRHLGRFVGALADAVAQHGDPVGDPEHLRQAMADIDDADAGPASLEHERVQLRHLLRPERGRRLVEQKDLRPREQRLHHLEQLTLCERQRPGRDRHRDVDLELRDLLRRPLVHAPERRLLRPGHGEIEVLGNRQVEEVRERLIRDAETEPPGRGGRVTSPQAAGDLDDALVGGEEAARDPEQCRFPGPVLPDEGVDLASAAVDADVAKRTHCSVRLGDAAKGQHRRELGPGNRHRVLTQLLLLIPPRGTSGGAGSAGSAMSRKPPGDSPWCRSRAPSGSGAGSGARSAVGSSRP